MPKLSVIVPFYNVQQYAPDTLRSLRLNADRDFEFILVDDHSKDETPAILERAAEDLSDVAQVRYIRHEKNGGLATARNTGLDAAQGEYLTFLDGDDWLAPGYLAELVSALDELGCDFIRTDHVQATARARSVSRVPVGRRWEAFDPREAILPSHRSTSVDYAYAWAGAYHRRLLDRGVLHFTDGLRTAEDRPWIWKLHREAESFAVVSLLGVFYRRGVASSLTQIGDVRQLDFIRAFDQVIEETAADREADRLLPKAVRTYCAIIAHHLSNEDRFEPAVARQLRSMSAAAIKRMPQDALGDALEAMDMDRSSKLRRLRRRVTPAGAAA
ncbi:glycosyltransferase family 2 protein [Streptomyces coeruleorubidus]|uniref:Glycosyltransferase family 2 protein n=1 Tax=Streptomyces coeruleorubidus TaxID=116188 RepID=A0A5J6IPK2_STRC4|nr:MULTISPECIES: glycosyltransferase family 2 protein [Streptomyces]MDG9708430.1 glycosyltransferase family 2 protein [Streptomyces sp. DH10]QEV30537.1 glycosyltransferase family 2 protein [Streptomyces coeruleorubidus]WOT34710.1 glycosyltransferase family 2 protein [Streptomyces coeruleorubidus]GGT68233.1 glycosyl transferase [Streptomyces coeruleorubidus]GGT86613.1 glycosyl transferase [Streptomyces bellus]